MTSEQELFDHADKVDELINAGDALEVRLPEAVSLPPLETMQQHASSAYDQIRRALEAVEALKTLEELQTAQYDILTRALARAEAEISYAEAELHEAEKFLAAQPPQIPVKE